MPHQGRRKNNLRRYRLLWHHEDGSGRGACCRSRLIIPTPAGRAWALPQPSKLGTQVSGQPPPLTVSYLAQPTSAYTAPATTIRSI